MADIDESVYREKKRTFLGSVKISLDKLRPEDNTRAPRQLNEVGVTRLLDRFAREGCLRHDARNYVPALISRYDLPTSDFRVDTVGTVTHEDPRDPPVYCPDRPVVYLDGKHRLEAARRFFIPSERWWIVNLYSDDLSPHVQDVLRCADSGSTKYSEGDIFRQIRISEIGGDEERRQRWLAKLNPNQRKNVARLNAMPTFLTSLDSKIQFVGLWSVVTMGMFAWYSRIHCPEELTRYSDLITETWTYILGDSESDHLRLDARTVKILEGRCPFRSSEDRTYIQMQMQMGTILPAVTSNEQRGEILERICSVPRLIPSFFTLHEDSKYLEAPMTILRQLLPIPHGRSISQQFSALHNSQENLLVQTSEFTFEERPTRSASFKSWISYRELVLAAFRHFPFMGGKPPRTNTRGKRLLQYGEQKSWWCEIFALGSRLGYRRLVQKYPDHKAANASIIRDCLHRTQPARYYMNDPENDGRVVQLISQVLVNKTRRTQMTVTPKIVSDVDDCGWKIEHRCGRPFEHSFRADEGSLFYDYIYSPTFVPQGRYLTSFGVKRDMFLAFFGMMPDEFRASLEDTVQEELREGLREREVINDPQPLVQITKPCSTLETTYPVDYLATGSIFRNTQRRSYLTAVSQYSISPVETPSSARERSPINFTEFSIGPWASQAPNQRQETPSMYVFGQQDADGDVSFTDASQLLFRPKKRSQPSTFTVLSPAINGRFRKRYANPQDTPSMVDALQVSSHCYFVAQGNGKRLKMAAPVTVLEEARSDRLRAVIAVSRQNVPNLIKQFESQEESDEEL